MFFFCQRIHIQKRFVHQTGRYIGKFIGRQGVHLRGSFPDLALKEFLQEGINSGMPDVKQRIGRGGRRCYIVEKAPWVHLGVVDFLGAYIVYGYMYFKCH